MEGKFFFAPLAEIDTQSYRHLHGYLSYWMYLFVRSMIDKVPKSKCCFWSTFPFRHQLWDWMEFPDELLNLD